MNSTKAKSFALLILVFSFAVLMAEIVARIYVEHKRAEIKAARRGDDVIDPEVRAMIDRYTDQLHHLRSVKSMQAGFAPHELLFTEITPFSKKKKANILLQGDSWAEQALLAKDLLLNVAQCSNTGLILAGVGSYSPTPMAKQIQVLREDFNIQPEIVVAVIDQTDIGDEAHRYTEPSFVGQSLQSVAEKGSYQRHLELRNRIESIYLSEGFAIKKIILRSKENINRHIRGRDSYSTPGELILRPLKNGVSKSEEKIFNERLSFYIRTVFNDKNLKRLVLVSHPHLAHTRNHDKSDMHKGDVRDLVKRVVHESPYKEKILMVNVDIQDPKLFIETDPFSHLTPEGYRLFYYPAILRRVPETRSCIE